MIWCALGKTEFSLKEDAHVIADCVKVFLFPDAILVFIPVNDELCKLSSCFFIKYLLATLQYFLRELPSSPVPASCCNALLEVCRKSVRGVCISLSSSIPVLPYVLLTIYMLKTFLMHYVFSMPNHFIS